MITRTVGAARPLCRDAPLLCRTTPPQPLCRLRPALCKSSNAPSSVPDYAALSKNIGSAWDPEGLLPPMPSSTDHFARRERSAAPTASAATTAAAAGPMPSTSQANPTPGSHANLPQIGLPLTPAVGSAEASALTQGSSSAEGAVVQEGLSPAALSPEEYAELEARLAREYMTVDLRASGLRVLSLDPPIFTVDNFFPESSCDALVAAAAASGCMQLSKVGGGNVASSSGSNQYHNRRNSSGMLVDNTVLEANPRLERLVLDFQSRGKGLLQAKRGRTWGKPGRMPSAGQYTYEGAQVTQYKTGQHFLSHEDAFPRGLAESNGFQRAATLLLYLNDVPKGGCTRFETLDLAVAPRKGKLLVFFPAKADGSADSRMLHTGEDAEDTTKHVIQQWVACGWGALPSAAAAASKAGAAGNLDDTVDGNPSVPSQGKSFTISVPVGSGAAGKGSDKKKKGGKGFGKK